MARLGRASPAGGLPPGRMSDARPHERLLPMPVKTSHAMLLELRRQKTHAEVAQLLSVNERTVRRWESQESTCPAYLGDAIRMHLTVDNEDGLFKFADLFAGIGGIRQAFDDVGGKCSFTSEWNSYAQQTYAANFPHREDHVFNNDITEIVDASAVPDHDVLLAGFPCQPFSIAGVSKKNALGRAHGFLDPTQGTLFFDVKRIIDAKRPAAFLLENVKNLQTHDRGKTFAVIRQTLEEELGYHVRFKVINGIHFRPQNRERIMIVGFREENDFSFDNLDLPSKQPTLDTVLHRADGAEPVLAHDEGRYFDHEQNAVPDRYTLTSNLWAYLQNYAAKHRAAGNGFGYGLVREGMTTRTLSARYYKDGSEILVEQPGSRPRRLTPRECARLMGFDDSFRIPVSDTQAYKQFGNSVVVPAVGAVAKLMLPYIRESVARSRAA